MRTSWKAKAAAPALIVLAALLATGGAQAMRSVDPVNTAPPTITGTPTVDQTLTAADGTWSNTPTSFTYQWSRCNSSGGSCASVANGTLKTYTLVGADVGSTMRVRVTATNVDGSASAQSAHTATVSAKAVPKNTAPPTISGTAQDGQKLTGSKGTWTGSPTDYNLYWTRCNKAGNSCVNIVGATAATYTLTSADVGNTLRFKVGAANQNGRTFASSDQTDVVTAAGPTNTAPPTLSGTPKVGQTLTADPGTWSGNPSSFTYQWQRCDIDVAACANLVGATGKAYVVPLADLGFRLRVAVTAHTAASSVAATSAITTVVVPAAKIVNHRPVLTILRVQFTGSTVYARFRICDDSYKNLAIAETDSRPGKVSYTRHFATLVAPRPCGVYARHWLPVARFRGPGRYTLTLRATDKSGLTSLPARRTFTHG
jgi:hypothetical protein